MRRLDLARSAFDALCEKTQPSGTAWARGVEARSRALLSDGDDADALYQQAISLLAESRLGGEAARAELLYGEWLRREGRRRDAREQLRAAHETFTTMAARPFAERAARELRATGETAREWHLRKVFGKLGIRSRRELRSALPDGSAAAVPV